MRASSPRRSPRRLGYSRNAVCAKLTRLDLKRRHKPPTAKPKIRPVPKRRPALLAACLEHRNQIGHSRNSLRGRGAHFLSAGVRATRVRKYPADSDVGGAVRRERQLVTRPFGHVKPKVRRRLTPYLRRCKPAAAVTAVTIVIHNNDLSSPVLASRLQLR
jgi:hypothetical protein